MDRGQYPGELRAVPGALSHYLPREDAIAAVERKVAKSLYMAEAAEKLVGRGLVTGKFINAWAAAKPGCAAEIRALLQER